MQEKVAAFIREHELIPRGGGVVAGVSGGADSVALLHILTSLAPSMNFTLYAAHLNHGIRGETAQADEDFVADLCEFYGVQLYRERADIPGIAKRRGETLEQAGRIERYGFLERARRKFGADVVAVAHHMDDQAESVLLHLTRGSGLTGLVGMQPKRGNIIRPMLPLRRHEIEKFVQTEGLAYHTDETNFDRIGTRNRIRLDLIPYIEEHINPAIVETLCSMSELLLRDEEYLNHQAAMALERAKRDIGYDRAMLKSLEPPILTRAIRAALFDAGARTDIERVHVESVITLLSARTGATLKLPKVEAWTSYGSICFGNSEAAKAFSLPLAVEGETVTPLGTFIAKYVDKAEFTADPYTAFFDAAKLAEAFPEAPLTVRTRKNGDRFHPIGAPGRRKLKEFFIDRKVPREKRILPLIACDGDILFVPGFCVSDAVKLTGTTTRVLRVQYIDINLYSK